jgi:hypothetical protein
MVPTLENEVDVGDELVRVFDLYEIRGVLSKGDPNYPSELQLFGITGPNAFALTPGDYAVTGGVKTALEAAMANGAVVKDMNVIHNDPKVDGAGVFCNTLFTLDLTAFMNDFTVKTENAKNASGSVPKGVIAGVSFAIVSTTDTYALQYRMASHYRKRRW